MTSPKCYLSLKKLKLMVKLGVSQKERKHAQEVTIDLDIYFSKPPRGTKTDKLENTICYATLVESIEGFCTHGEFHLLEHLGWEIYNFLHLKLPRNNRLCLRVQKKPPIKNLAQAAFVIDDHEFNR